MNDYTSIADLYDLYVTDTRDHRFWTRWAARAAGPVLELTAGTGRATAALHAGATHPLVALDLSAAMLRRLAGRFAEARPPVGAVSGDLTALPFRPACYDLAVIPFNSLGELVEPPQRAVALRELRRVLAPGGRAIVTLHNPTQRRRTLDGEVRRLGPFPAGDRRLEVLVRGRLIDADLAISEQTYRVLGPDDNLVEERRLSIRFALPDVSTLAAEARAAGLEIEALFGDYDESPCDPARSPFILAVLARSEGGPRGD